MILPKVLLQFSLLALPALSTPVNNTALLLSCLQTSSLPLANTTTLTSAPFNALLLPPKPLAVVIATSPSHVQSAVRCGASAGIRVTPRAGGHSWANYGLGGEDGHLVIELDRMRNVSLDEGSELVMVQAGSRLGHLAWEISKAGRALSHGTCPTVGVAGHVLHGGYGMSSHTHGLLLDALTSATLVLPTGALVTTSAKSNPDLFWALRGAGSSFGVVVDFTFQTFPAPTTVTPFLAVLPWANASVATAGFAALQNFTQSGMPKELNMRLMVAPRFFNLEGLWHGDRKSLEQVLNPLLTAMGGRLVQATTTDWLGQLKHFGNGLELDQTQPPQKQEKFYSSSLYTDVLTNDQITSFLNYTFATARPTPRSWYVQIDVHGGLNSSVSTQDPALSSYAHRDALFLYSFYDRVDLKDEYPADGFQLINGFKDAITLGGTPQGMYYNYPDPALDQAEAQAMYWGDSLARLQRIKAKYDPWDLFHLPQSVRPGWQ